MPTETTKNAATADPRGPAWAGPAALSAVLAVIATGLALDAAGVGLGAPLPPLFATWDPTAEIGWLAVSLILVAGAVALAPVMLDSDRTPPRVFAAGVLGLGLALRLAVGAIREGAEGWHRVFGLDAEAANEYLPALPALDLGWTTFLDRFAELSPTLPIHPSAHPPGLLLLVDALGMTSARSFATLVIGAGVLAVPLTYALGRRLLDEHRARVAALLFAIAPSGILYGVASADALFVSLGLLAAIGLLGRRWIAKAAGALALAVASFFSWALLAIGAYAVFLEAARNRAPGRGRLPTREALQRAAGLAAISGAGVIAFYAALYAATGFDPLGTIEAANEAYELGISRARPYLFWVFGSPAAMLFAAGLPIVWFAGRSLGAGHPVAIGIWTVIGIAAVLGFSKAETERIWLFMVPLLCIAAAAVLPRERMPLLVALLGAQAVATEVLLDTVW